MKKLVVLMLAASALAPASAMAQRTAAPPVKWEDTPRAQLRVQMPSAHSAMPHVRMHPAPAHMPVVVRHHGPGGAHVKGANRIIVRHGGSGMGIRRHDGVRNFSSYRRFDRGFVLPQTWWGPQFQISNWGMYGLPQPVPGGRWVRYYDDALMLDGYGRVTDGRWGMSWDQWGDQWDYDDRGVPVYVGDGDYYPGEEDYGWVDRGRGGFEGNGFDQGYAHGGGCPQTCAPPPPPAHYPYGHGSGYGSGYGYGWGYGGTVVVTETTVTTAPSVVTETYYEEEVVQRRAHKARKHRAKPRYHRPVPQPGERG